jgi:hypothetical protein
LRRSSPQVAEILKKSAQKSACGEPLKALVRLAEREESELLSTTRITEIFFTCCLQQYLQSHQQLPLITTASQLRILALPVRFEPSKGAIVGGGVGAVIGHQVGGHNSTVIGGVIGTATGAIIASDNGRTHRSNTSYYYASAPVYYAPAPAYRSTQVYYRNPPVVRHLPPPPPRNYGRNVTHSIHRR